MEKDFLCVFYLIKEYQWEPNKFALEITWLNHLINNGCQGHISLVCLLIVNILIHLLMAGSISPHASRVKKGKLLWERESRDFDISDSKFLWLEDQERYCGTTTTTTTTTTTNPVSLIDEPSQNLKVLFQGRSKHQGYRIPSEGGE